MRYRLTCLTPLLVGDGRKLSPIDYMVWKDQVNVLDQRRIFQLLAKGPRLDNYLTQLKRADKLDFSSWGGFAQNFADRRIPFEDPSCTAHWERAKGDSLHIPTFFTGAHGPCLPGSAIKGALRTAVLFSGLNDDILQRISSQFQGDRSPKRPAEMAEDKAIGQAGASRMRVIRAYDSEPVSTSSMKIYLLRIATLQGRGAERYELGWKQAPRGTVDGRRPEDAAAFFAEMATPGTVFEGTWQENSFVSQPEIARALNWREPLTLAQIFQASNRYSDALLDLHKQYAGWTRLTTVAENVENLQTRLAEVRQRDNACLFPLGWGNGLLGKIAWLKTEDEAYRRIIRQSPLYGKSISPTLPFPKTRRIIFVGNRPATLPGWVLLEVLAE
jgi:CRISPR-associated protein Csm5